MRDRLRKNRENAIDGKKTRGSEKEREREGGRERVGGRENKATKREK